MSPDTALDQLTQAMVLVMWLSMPPIIVASGVGIIISLLQALTQIQEQTLSFAVKLIAVAATAFPISKLEEMVNVGTLFAFVLVSAGVIILRRTRPDLQRGFKAPFVPVLPILSIAACLWLMINLTVLTWIRFVIWMVVGIVVYALYGYRHSRLARTGYPVG